MKLSTALCAYVLCVCSLIFVGITIVLEFSAAEHQAAEVSRITSMMQSDMIESVAARLRNIESDVQYVARIASSSDAGFTDDEAERLESFLVSGDSLIMDASFDFSYGAGRGEAEDVSRAVQMAEWSVPYLDKEGSGSLVTDYTLPIQNYNGRQCGTLTAKVTLDSIYSLLRSLQPYADSKTYVIDKSGNVVGVSLSDSGSDKANSDMFRYIIGQSHTAQLNDHVAEIGGRRYIINYDSLPRREAIVCTVTPYDEVSQSVRSLNGPLFIVVGSGFLLLLCGIWLVFRLGSRPLRKLTKAAEEIADGDFNAQLPESMRFADLRRLRDAMQKMECTIQAHVARRAAELAEKKRIADELELAAAIQQSMLPDLSEGIFGPLSVSGLLRPALEVSGDLYDVVTCDVGTYFIVADVSGKGMPASLVMASVRSLFRFAAAQAMSPAEILHRVNAQLCEGNAGCMFVTAIVGCIDAAGVIKLANAGHTPPIVVGQDTHSLTLPAALPIGVMDDVDYEEKTIRLNMDESLLMYTDGVTEAESDSGGMFGIKRLISLISALPSNKRTPADVVKAVDEGVKNFAPDTRADDLTLLCIRLEVRQDKVCLPYDAASLALLASFVENFGQLGNWDSRMVMNVNLALEEGVSNVIFHSEAPGEDSMIEVTLRQSGSCVEARVVDGGRMFNPLSAALAPDLTSEAADRPVGGLGIHMMRKLSKKMTFEYKNQKNILTIIF